MLNEHQDVMSENRLADADRISRSKLIIRPMEERGREGISAVLRYQHAQTIFRKQPFSDEKYDSDVDHVLSSPPRMLCPVVELDAKAVGVAWAGADTYILAEGPLCVTVYGLAVETKEL